MKSVMRIQLKDRRYGRRYGTNVGSYTYSHYPFLRNPVEVSDSDTMPLDLATLMFIKESIMTIEPI